MKLSYYFSALVLTGLIVSTLTVPVLADNPPGPRGGAGAGPLWENPPGKAGGPGSTAGRVLRYNGKPYTFVAKAAGYYYNEEYGYYHPKYGWWNQASSCWLDPDGNPPGTAGGRGTNWENPPGIRGGAGTEQDKFARCK